MSDDPDAIVIGAGPNGLVAANVLADAGWSVLVLEAQPDIGGAVHSDSELDPDFVHDTFSAFYPLGAGSPVMGGLDLQSYGLTWKHAPAVLGHPRPDGGWALLHHDVDMTAAGLDEHAAGDGDRWHELHRDWQRIGPSLVESLMSPFPPVKGGLKTLARLPSVGGLAYVKMLLEPARQLVESRFDSEEAKLLIAGNGGHADIPLDATGSGLMALLLVMLAQTVGYPVPEGGASELPNALARRLESKGGSIRCDARVDGIAVRDRRARGVRIQGGETISAARAIIADVSATSLYGGLIGWDHLPTRTRRDMRQFRYDPATVKVDWALDGPVPWASTPALAPGTVHIADSLDQMTTALQQVGGHTIPAHPFLLMGQMTTADPTRSPAGTESLWAYTHVPQEVRSDGGGDDITGVWDHTESERMADRMQGRIEKYAPGFTSRIRARRVLAPPDLERRNANLVGGSINGGTSDLHQQLVFRPVPGLGRAGTPIRGLYLGSAAAHPGGGVHGAPGANAARAAIAAHRTGRL